MDTAQQAELEEKARLQRQLELQEGHSLQPSPSRSPESGSNTVPMTEEELCSSPAPTSQRSPVPARVPVPVRVVPVHMPSDAGSLTPPPYSGPTTPALEPPVSPDAQTASPSRPPRRYPGLPALDYRLYKPPLFELSADRTTIRTSAAHLSTNADALVALIRQQATVPPKPQIQIVGRRGVGSTSSSTSPPSGRGVDFAIKLNLLPLLVPEDPRQRLDYLRCVGAGEVALRGGSSKPSTQPDVGDGGDGGGGVLEAWAARFVADPAAVKSFALERVVANLDVHWLEGQIRALAAGMRYPGAVAVSFPVTHARVVVHSPDRVNKFFTSVTGFFAGRSKYEVVKAVWPFATVQRGGEGGDGRRCGVQSEETWWREWRDPIRHAIATKRHGWVTNEDKLEALMEGAPSGTPAVVDWGPDGSV